MNLLNFFDIDKLFLCRQLCCLEGEGGLGGKAVENYSAEVFLHLSFQVLKSKLRRCNTVSY